jgi:hypothetical protein
MTIIEVVEILLVKDSCGGTMNHLEVTHPFTQRVAEKAEQDDCQNQV